MEIEEILSAVTFDSLSKMELSVLLSNLTDHVRISPQRFELLRCILLDWNANKPSRLPTYPIIDNRNKPQ